MSSNAENMKSLRTDSFNLQIENDPFPRRPLSERSNLYLEKKGETETKALKSSAKHSSPITLLLANITAGDTKE